MRSIVFALILTAPLAFGQRRQQMDRNRSGAVESYEWPYNPELFRQLDRDGDGVLTTAEFRSFNQLTLTQLDTNKNGTLDANEWPGRFADFKRLDQDGDGKVSAEEYFTRGGGFAQNSASASGTGTTTASSRAANGAQITACSTSLTATSTIASALRNSPGALRGNSFPASIATTTASSSGTSGRATRRRSVNST